MDLISTPGELVDQLFRELDESEPPQNVHPTFLHSIGGICHGLGYGTCCGDPPYLSEILVTDPTSEALCGVKLVAFAKALGAEGCLDPAQGLTVTRLIQLMLAALGSPDIELRISRKTGRCRVVSNKAYEARRACKIRVPLDGA